MPTIIPIKELRNINEISEKCHSKAEPVFVTKNGYGDLVIMSMETYENIIHSHQIDKAIAEAEEEIANGWELQDAKDILASLRRKYIDGI